jgi:hypothetical protein
MELLELLEFVDQLEALEPQDNRVLQAFKVLLV